MVAVLNKRWLSKGWRVMDIADSEPMALAWIEILNRSEIPYEHYFDLYRRSLDLRVRLLNKGQEADDFSADMMAACWPSLQIELRERDISAGRTLTTTAPSQCLRCYGTGMEAIYNEAGEKVGVRPGCLHEFIDESDPHMEGFAQAEAALKYQRDETALEICMRIRKELAYEFVKEGDTDLGRKVWAASRTWVHAEKYVRENPD